MKHRLVLPSLTILCAFAFASCGGGEKEAAGAAEEKSGGQEETAPPEKTKGATVRANEVAKKAALDRVETMKQITAVLKPLRDPEAALAKEEELEELFTEYNRLTAVAAAEGIEGRLLAGLTAHLAPGDWVDARAEFQQYMLLVRQLGEPQREMMDRLMKIGAPEGAQAAATVEDHLKVISGAADKAKEEGAETRPKREVLETKPE